MPAPPAEVHDASPAIVDAGVGEYLYRGDLYRRIQAIVNPAAAATPSRAPPALTAPGTPLPPQLGMNNVGHADHISSDATVVDAVRLLHCCICAAEGRSPPRRRDRNADNDDGRDGNSTTTTSALQARDVSRAVLMACEEEGGGGGLLEELVMVMMATISREYTLLTDHQYGDNDDSEATMASTGMTTTTTMMMEVIGTLAGASEEAAARCVRAGAVCSLVGGLSAGRPPLTSAPAARNTEKALSLLLLLASSCPEGRTAGQAQLPALLPALAKKLLRVSDKATASSIALLSLLLLPHHAPAPVHGCTLASSTNGEHGDHLMIDDIKALAASSSLVGKLVLVLQLPPINQSTTQRARRLLRLLAQ